MYEVHYFCPSLSSILCEMCSHLLELRRNAGHTFPCLLPQPVHLPPAESDSQPFISICVFINPSERSGLGYTNQFSLIVTAKFYFLQCWSEPLPSVPDLPPPPGGDLQSPPPPITVFLWLFSWYFSASTLGNSMGADDLN